MIHSRVFVAGVVLLAIGTAGCGSSDGETPTEVEPNDRHETATLLDGAGEYVVSGVCGQTDDYDWFRVDPPDGEMEVRVELKLRWHSATDNYIFVEVWSPSSPNGGWLMDSVNQYPDDSAGILTTATPYQQPGLGELYVRLWCPPDVEISYQGNWTITPTGA